jgi:putative flippase GtrA
VVAANLLSTSAGMAFSFVANGRWTFAGRLTRRTAALFLATTGATMWLLQPAVIEALLHLWGDGATAEVLGAKVLAIGVSVTANFAAYRFLVWPTGTTTGRRPSGRAAAPWAARR